MVLLTYQNYFITTENLYLKTLRTMWRGFVNIGLKVVVLRVQGNRHLLEKTSIKRPASIKLISLILGRINTNGQTNDVDYLVSYITTVFIQSCSIFFGSMVWGSESTKGKENYLLLLRDYVSFGVNQRLVQCLEIKWCVVRVAQPSVSNGEELHLIINVYLIVNLNLPLLDSDSGRKTPDDYLFERMSKESVGLCNLLSFVSQTPRGGEVNFKTGKIQTE